MKLVKPPEAKQDTIKVVRKRRHRTLGQFLRGEPGDSIKTMKVRGRTVFSSCIVECDPLEPLLELGSKAEPIELDDITIYGLLPVLQISERTFECSIDCFTRKAQ